MRTAATLGPMLVAGLLLATPNPALADGELAEHPHQPRHGGYFGDADDLYHYEVLLTDQRQLVLYVNDQLNRPLDVRRLKGQWRLSPDEPRAPSGAFRPSDDGDRFIASLPPDEADPLHVEVAVLKGRQWVRMEFFLPAAPTSTDGSVK